MEVYHVPRTGQWKSGKNNQTRAAVPRYFIPQGNPGISLLFFLLPNTKIERNNGSKGNVSGGKDSKRRIRKKTVPANHGIINFAMLKNYWTISL